MAMAIDRSRRITCGGDVSILWPRFGELPVQDLVHRDSANTYRPLFSQNGDAAFEIPWIGEHRDIDRAHRTAAPAQGGDTTVLNFNVTGQRAGVGHDTFNRANQPVQQVNVMTGLVHESATVVLPSPTPFRAVVILLRTSPENVHRHGIDLAKPALLHGTLEQQERRISAVLLDDEEAHVGVVAGLDHPHAIVPARRHRLFGHYVTP